MHTISHVDGIWDLGCGVTSVLEYVNLDASLKGPDLGFHFLEEKICNPSETVS